MKIFDCFMFFDEEMLLDFRLETSHLLIKAEIKIVIHIALNKIKTVYFEYCFIHQLINYVLPLVEL